MREYDLIATTAFGIESVTARELSNLGYECKTENGRILFRGDETAIARANMWLRTADRVLICAATFKAVTFEELFQGVYAIPWESYLTEDAEIHVVGKSVDSVLFSVPDCQSITKKAIIERMKTKYHRDIFDESGPKYKVAVALLKDVVTISIDTTGSGLHKRGYRSLAGEAPLKETMACAMLQLSFWRGERLLVDPFCGSGTIPIEAAMMSLNMAPGSKRNFICESWENFASDVWIRAREEAHDLFTPDRDLNIYGSDIDPSAIQLAMLHAEEAGVDEYIKIKKMDVREFRSEEKYGFIVTNPPYGERLGTATEIEKLYRDAGKVFARLDNWSYYVITSYPYLEKLFGRKADKRRKLYNGRLECQYYQFLGEKPQKEKKFIK